MIRSLVLLLLFSTGLVHAQNNRASEAKKFAEEYKRNIQKSRLNGVYIPKDIDDAMKQLDRKSDASAAETFKKAPEDVVVQKLHFGLGRWMIHNWNLEFGSRLSYQLTQLGLKHHDDMAQLLIRCYHRHLNGVPMDPKSIADDLVEVRERKKAERFRDAELETLSTKKIGSSN